MNQPDVLIVSYRRADLLKRCLESVHRFMPDSAVFVWENQSEGSRAITQMLKLEWPQVKLLTSSTNRGFAYGVNRLAEVSSSSQMLILNPDAVLTSDLADARKLLERDPKVAAVAPWIRGSGPRPWDNAHRRNTVLRMLVSFAGYASTLRMFPLLSDLYAFPPDYVDGYLSGACLLVSRAAWDHLGGFDETYFLYSEEVDWAARAVDAGFKLSLTSGYGAEHVAAGTVGDSPTGSSLSRDLLQASRRRYLRTWSGRGAELFFAFSCTLLEALQRSKRKSRR